MEKLRKTWKMEMDQLEFEFRSYEADSEFWAITTISLSITHLWNASRLKSLSYHVFFYKITRTAIRNIPTVTVRLITRKKNCDCSKKNNLMVDMSPSSGLSQLKSATLDAPYSQYSFHWLNDGTQL